MSHWYEPKIKDMFLTDDGKELNIFIGSDDFGNNYVSLEVEELKKFLSTNQ